MALLTAQQISRYFELFSSIDVTFTREVITTVGLQTKNIFLKHVGQQIPCVIYSVSMTGARVIVNVKSDAFAKIHQNSNAVSLRFSFVQSDRLDPLSFYVNSKIAGFSPYGKGNVELNFVSLAYLQRAPDDLITVLGQLLEANVNAKKRHEERIVVTSENVPKLGLRGNDAVVYIEGVPRKCIVRDLSFSGCRLIIPGIAKFLGDKPATLHLGLDDKSEIQIEGRIIRTETVSGREDIVAIAILYNESEVPLSYKMRINDYLTAVRQPAGAKAGGPKLAPEV
jgi:PilZN3 domain/PilZ domain